MNVSILGCGNVGVAIAADLSIGGHDVSLIKTSHTKESVYDKIRQNGNRVLLKENGDYKTAVIKEVSHNISKVDQADVVFVTIQSTYHEELIERINRYLHQRQIVVCICSYLSSFYFKKHCKFLPTIVETAGPYLEGRIEENDTPGEVVFRVGCRLSRSPLSIFQQELADECMVKIHQLYKGFSNDYSVMESALLNPNMVLHTVGSVMSIPRIEYSKGDFCMYREAYARGNDATFKVMMQLDAEKKDILKRLGCNPVDIFAAGGFLGDPIKSFYDYAESPDRAISPTSVRSRYITEDVSQGLVLLENIAQIIGMVVPVASSLITISGAALGIDFREVGRTAYRLDAVNYIHSLIQ
ncbi:NAD/NADP octopine/nopaline dehydrogenase family protein [uncultured Bacteroides sp.]|uniref:NAD/NADP octopine/nopaline dehydrogenase family protein n=1 Tax=uncultured Bacteroides sp. TaxID=162156 RepID=UPI002603075A|nr:NAD/NADP octopine/nopaline dehydrogenase family protein [uncultured Bacteroides sp.]